jgi:carbamoyltransferase
MVIDAQGSRARDCTEAFRLPAGVDPQMLEIASFYRADGNRFECIAKQVWDGDWDAPVGLGCFYYLLTRMLFPVGEGNEGKVMGLAPFGEVHAMAMPELVVEGHAVFIPSEWVKLFNERERYQYSDDPRSFRASADLAAEGQHAFEEALLRVAQWLHQQTGDENLCFAGGTALNCSANGRLMREGPFGGLFIPPSTHDGGTAVGCAVHGLVNELGVQSSFRWRHDFLGPQHAENEARDAVSHAGDDVVVEQPDDLVATVVDLLEDGHVVGVCHQRSESGPRALGNRSILADARRPDMQDFINSRVKGREWFRPLAPIVLAEAASTVFCIDRPSPFMQFAARVRPEHAAALPAITHVDGSARLQTVDSETTPMLRAILELFASRTGCPVLLNTSLNGKGDPIVETPDEALACLRSTAMHALVIPPFVVRKVAG